MTMLPEWKLCLLGGWLPMVFLYLVFGLLLLLLPKQVVKRLYDSTGRPRRPGLRIPLVLLTLAFLGIVLATGSWLMLIFFILILPFVHLKVKAEETACLALYGDSYKQYMAQRPRYFVFF